MLVILTILSAALLTAANYYPDLYFLSWIGFFPFLYFIFILNKNELNYKRAFLAGWKLGFWILIFSSNFLYHSIEIYTEASFFLIIFILILLFSLLAFVYAVFFMIYFYFQQKLFAGNQFNPFLFAIVWTVMEVVRYYLFYFFPLANLAYTQVEFLSFIQLAEIGGIWILTFIMVLVNALIFKLIFYRQAKNAFVIVLIFLFIFIFANYRAEIVSENTGQFLADQNFKIGIITSRIDQNRKWNLSQLEQNLNLTLDAASNLVGAELIIAPETNITFDFHANQKYREKFLNKIAAEFKKPVQIGSLAGRDSISGRFNSSFLISPAGEIISRYDKNLLLYFGERFPFEDTLNKYIPYNFSSLNAGQQLRIFKYNNFKWKTVICSEILYPDYVKDGSENVDFIVNQTNEAWFKESRLLKNLMWQAAVLRAVENRTVVVKTGNYSHNGIIYPLGNYEKTISGQNYHLLNLNQASRKAFKKPFFSDIIN
ncbi:Apolipoprotein N-acyltransferase [Halanaerobium congolense]|jgi:apolipoprotein N-acyltransferase|uniref:Apolipoprotein N-acyltransferase n=1 Tax=Halanaerobium congolense TaxID=54121 RepID=A0A1G8MXD5_9FIRM|nr:apolipoprotein N-acyltransferase [Halanaerobium congolense]PUU87186.1 MAG: apolipoprotein N-acyltransferase [Halanaerobium sp.]PXV70140.1 apolipoprotein N-acyltransferase [Halanaerobium congolense]SDI72622.1 Apolipoprotein N-acyltransferase [Halanaerobium congolense]SET42874.1 Apolipoprotein N-acyltransferase [Halanaerobium congolense]